MFRSGCISIVVLVVLGFAFDLHRRELLVVLYCSQLKIALAQSWTNVEKQLQAVHYGCLAYRNVTVTRLRVTGSGNVSALKRDLTNIAKIEFDKSGVNPDGKGDFTVVVETDTREHPKIGFTMHCIAHHGFQSISIVQTGENRAP